MSNLFIIGNGFDISHGIPSSYNDFREYLITTYPEANHDELIVPEPHLAYNDSYFFDENEVAGFVIYILDQAEGEDWKDVETSMGNLDFTEYFDQFEQDYDESSDYEWRQAADKEDLANNLIVPTSKIKELFSEWINTICLDNVCENEDFSSFFENPIDILSFNYTETIEQVYGVQDVCHIHGMQGEELLFGHGDDTDHSDYYMIRQLGAQDVLSDIDRKLKKETWKALSSNAYFFNGLLEKNVSDIYSHGFSFSSVDRIYLKKIFEIIDTCNITWYFNDYDSKTKINDYENILKELNFKGQFLTYHIN
ncbi:TPA: bacteriophage abortive infection AbiH family protein [Listeria innocua]